MSERDRHHGPVLVRLDSDGQFDEFFADNASVHFERMDNAAWWCGIDLPNGDRWMLNFGALNQQAGFFFRLYQDKVGGNVEYLAANGTSKRAQELLAEIEIATQERTA